MSRKSVIDMLGNEIPAEKKCVIVSQTAGRSSVLNNPLTRSPVFAPVIVGEKAKAPIVTRDEIETIGAEAGQKLQTITTNMLKLQRASSSDEMGDRLQKLVIEAKGLSPDKTKRSFVSTLLRKVLRAKEDLFAEFDTVNGRIQVLSKQIGEDIRNQQQSLKDIDKLIEANEEFAKAQNRDYEVYCVHLKALQENFALIPDDDVSKADAQDIIDTLEIKLGDVKAIRLMSVQMAPKLVNMRKNAMALCRTANNILTNVIPAYTLVFSAYLESMKQKKAAQLQNNVIDEFNTAIQEGNRLSNQNDADITRLANRQLISKETLEEGHNLLVQSLEDLDTIRKQAREDRAVYVEDLNVLENKLVEVYHQRR